MHTLVYLFSISLNLGEKLLSKNGCNYKCVIDIYTKFHRKEPSSYVYKRAFEVAFQLMASQKHHQNAFVNRRWLSIVWFKEYRSYVVDIVILPLCESQNTSTWSNGQYPISRKQCDCQRIVGCRTGVNVSSSTPY